MWILVTGLTVLWHPQPALLRVLGACELHDGRGLELGFVAGAAFGFGVFALEVPPCLLMVELLGAALIPVDEIKIPAGMFGMTLGTVAIAYPSVETVPILLEPADLLVTGEALVVHDLGLAGMTLGAVE